MGPASIPPSPFLHPCILVHLHLHIPWSFCRLAPLSSYPLPFFFPFVSFFAPLSSYHSLPFPVALPSPAPQPSPPPRPRPRIPLCPSSAPFPIIRLFARHSVAFPCLHASAKLKYAPGAGGRNGMRDSWASMARRRTWWREASAYPRCARHS